MYIDKFVKDKRMAAGLTQPELAEKAGVGLRFVRELEQGKQTLRIDKVNQVLQLFGYQLEPVEIKRNVELELEPGKMTITGHSPTITVKMKRQDEKG
jgi:y4mF family transcriptional regulator